MIQYTVDHEKEKHKHIIDTEAATGLSTSL